MVKHSKLLNKQTGDAYVKPEDAALTVPFADTKCKLESPYVNVSVVLEIIICISYGNHCS